MTPWEITGVGLANCNCDYGCPCQFNALPTHGNCEAILNVHIEKGHYGSTNLDGLNMALIVYYPGPVHEGKGKGQPVIDIRADEDQRKAMLAILTGQDTNDFATHFFVYTAMCETIYDPVYAAFDFDVDVEARTGKIKIDGVAETSGRPIRNPVTGDPHRVRIDLPHGFEYEIAEIGSASTKASGKVELNLDDTYGQFNRLHLKGSGPIRSRAV